MKDFGLDDQKLFPLLDEQSAATLRRLREHPNAPRYNWRTGERLTASGLKNVRDYADRVKSRRTTWAHGQTPPWLWPFIHACRADVPFYRLQKSWPNTDVLHEVPVTRSSDIRQQPWAFVPDGLPLDELITYTTSGTTGTRLLIPASPELPNRYLPLFEHAIASHGVRIEGGGRTSIIHICAQSPTVILCSISSYFGGAGCAKINLNDADWNKPDDAARFLDDTAAEIYTGDPFALWRLTQYATKHRPKAIISAGTALSAGMRTLLSSHFACPVIDVYSTNESGPIAFSIADGTHEILPPELYVEVLDENDQPCPPGVRGQIVLTGGLNPYLPLVRYATGDHAAIEFADGSCMPRLVGFQGREPTVFRDTAGRWFNSIDISTALTHLPLTQLSLNQKKDGALILRCAGDEASLEKAVAEVRRLFGAVQIIDAALIEDQVFKRKPITFTNDASPF